MAWYGKAYSIGSRELYSIRSIFVENLWINVSCEKDRGKLRASANLSVQTNKLLQKPSVLINRISLPPSNRNDAENVKHTHYSSFPIEVVDFPENISFSFDGVLCAHRNQIIILVLQLTTRYQINSN